MGSYEVQASRDGKFWLIDVPAIKRSTQARNVAEIDVMARDLIAIMEEVEPDSFEITVEFVLPQEITDALKASAEHRESAAALQSQAAREVRRAARQLKALGLPLRDIGAVLGVSYQRVFQLVQDTEAEQVS